MVAFPKLHRSPCAAGHRTIHGRAICSIAFNQPAPILDGNLVRVLSRFYLIETDAKAASTVTGSGPRHEIWWKPPPNRRIEGVKIQTLGNCSALNQSLMELAPRSAIHAGPTVIGVRWRPVAPRGDRANRNSAQSWQATRAQSRTFSAIVIETGGRFLVNSVRPARSTPISGNSQTLRQVVRKIVDQPLKTVRTAIAGTQRVCTIRHSITTSRITLEVFRTKLEKKTEAVKRWSGPPPATGIIPFTSAHRKIIEKLQAQPGPA